MVVERFGKLHNIHDSGYFIAIPFVDSIAYVIDVRERAVDILPQSAITRDNVSVEVSGNLFVRVADPERAAYGARNPLYAIMMVSLFIDWWNELFCICICLIINNSSPHLKLNCNVHSTKSWLHAQTNL